LVEFDPFSTPEHEAYIAKLKEEMFNNPRKSLAESIVASAKNGDGKLGIADYFQEYIKHGDPEKNGLVVKAKKKNVDHNSRCERYLLKTYPLVKKEERTVWVRGMPFKKDLHGFIDWVAAHHAKGPFVGVQLTSIGCKSARLRKIAQSKPARKWLNDGNSILLLCYGQPNGPRTPYVPMEFWLGHGELDESNERAEKRNKKRGQI